VVGRKGKGLEKCAGDMTGGWGEVQGPGGGQCERPGRGLLISHGGTKASCSVVCIATVGGESEQQGRA